MCAGVVGSALAMSTKNCLVCDGISVSFATGEECK